MPTGVDLLGEYEVHSPAGIRALLAAGVSPTELINGKRPIDALIESIFDPPDLVSAYSSCWMRVLHLAIRCSKPYFLTMTPDCECSSPYRAGRAPGGTGRVRVRVSGLSF